MQLWVKHANENTMATEAVDKSGDVARERLVRAFEQHQRLLAEK
jgi:hypothetical protein